MNYSKLYIPFLSLFWITHVPFFPSFAECMECRLNCNACCRPYNILCVCHRNHQINSSVKVLLSESYQIFILFAFTIKICFAILDLLTATKSASPHIDYCNSFHFLFQSLRLLLALHELLQQSHSLFIYFPTLHLFGISHVFKHDCNCVLDFRFWHKALLLAMTHICAKVGMFWMDY